MGNNDTVFDNSKEKLSKKLTEIGCSNLQPVKTIHTNDWFTVFNRGGYFTVEYHLPQVITLPLVENQAIVMVRVKRPVLNDTPLELPAGCAEKGELPVEGAIRELAEETGIKINDTNRMIPMPSMAMSPNRTPKLAHVFKINLTQQEFDNRSLHDDEIVNVECIDLEKVAQMMSNGKICVAGVLALLGIYLSSRWLKDLNGVKA